MTSHNRRRHLALLGGFRYVAAAPAPEEILSVAAIGGADLDLTGAPLPPVTTITKVSLVGGVKLRVPADAEVQVSGLNIVGGRDTSDPTAPAEGPTPVIRLRAYGLFGGVSVQRG
jgi:predicted membrane protein